MIKAHIKPVLKEFENKLTAVDDQAVEQLIDQIRQAKRLFIAGKGRSGMQMNGFAMRLMHMGFQVYVVGETTTPSIQKGDLLILGSGSGNTESLLTFAKQAQAQGAQLALFTQAAKSQLREQADVTLTLPKQGEAGLTSTDTPNQPSRLPMGSSFALSLAILLELIILSLMAATETPEQEMKARHANME